ncbi:MAG: hypothetical protein ACM3X6_07480 [Patescibacteria group bacterium]
MADLPLLHVDRERGAFCLPDGTETLLFGVNYLGAMYQYISRYYAPLDANRHLFRSLGFADSANLNRDIKTKVLDRDLDDLQRMGMDLVRLHILMGDIALADGRLREGSDELDWFDYLLAGAIRRGMYIFLTPVTQWDVKVTLPGRISEPGWQERHYTTDPGAVARARDYVYNLMTHVNPYLAGGRGRSYAEEPGIGLIELQNEPAIAPGLSYAWYRDEVIDGMLAAVRRAEEDKKGVRHAVGWSMFGWPGGKNPAYINAVRDSGVDFITAAGYVGWWDFVPEAPSLGRYPYYGGGEGGPENECYVPTAELATFPGAAFMDAGRGRRARAVYEWDGVAVTKNYVLPNIAAHLRAAGAQVAAHFQYDMFVDGHKNSVWDHHYMQYMYAPERALSLMVAKEAFLEIQPGAPIPDGADTVNRLSPHAATSFQDNVSLFYDGKKLIHSGPLPAPMAPAIDAGLEEAIGLGGSPVVDYDGTGLYRIKKTRTDGRELLELEINPDVAVHPRTYVRSEDGRAYTSPIYFNFNHYDLPWDNADEVPICRELQSNRRTMRLRWPGMRDYAVYRLGGDGAETLVAEVRENGAFEVVTGAVDNASRPIEAAPALYRIRPL